MRFEDRMSVATPEGIELELVLAGFGSRFTAGLVDQLVKLLLIGLLSLALLVLGALSTAFLIPTAAVVWLGYDVTWEVFAQGRTPGKRLTGLRVLRGDGRPVELRASLVRNVLRLIDGYPTAYLPTVVGILATRRNQRPGDLAADTVVVRDRRAADASAPPETAARTQVSPPAWDVSGVQDAQVAALRAYLARRESLDAAARARIGRQLADAMRPHVGGATEIDPDRFIEGVLAAKAARERAV